VTKLTSGTLICGSALIAGTIILAGCQSQSPAAAADAPAAAPEAKPRAEQALLEDLAVANRILTKELAILDIQAHVTARSRTNPNHYYIARFIAPGAAVTSDFIENDLDSKPVDGPRNDQAREIYLHGEIFKARPDVMAVVHAHTNEFVAFGLSSVPLWDGDVALPVFDLRPFNNGHSGIIFTPALGRAMAEKMGNNEAVLLWGHGIALGASSIPAVITRVAQLRDSGEGPGGDDCDRREVDAAPGAERRCRGRADVGCLQSRRHQGHGWKGSGHRAAGACTTVGSRGARET